MLCSGARNEARFACEHPLYSRLIIYCTGRNGGLANRKAQAIQLRVRSVELSRHTSSSHVHRWPHSPVDARHRLCHVFLRIANYIRF